MFKRLLLALIITGNLIFAQNVVINEIMASNQTTILDEDGDASDYLELYNKGTEPINLTGYYLSDNIEKIQKWQFGNAVIEPGEYLIVFASDKDRQTTYLHTNFKISASGESIILSDTSGTIIDQVDLPESMVDISYARITDGSPDWVFQLPTPGSANTGTETLGTSVEVTVSYPGGFYSTAISVELTAGDCRIFYTLDGSDPDSNKTEYLSPINIDSTAVLKAISYKANYLPSPILYQTYFINESTSLPVISLSTDPYNLFDYNYGIYANGPGYTSADPHYGANFWMDWERPAHVEFYDDDKQLGFSKNCIIAIYGAWSRAHPQKSFSVKFKDGIEPLEYKLFPDLDLTTYKAFVLRNSGNDFYNTHMRDAMMQTLIQDLDIDYLEYRPAITFINGQYWGVYNIREKINEHYVAYHHGVDKDNIDMLENNMQVIHGDAENYRQIINYLDTHDMSTDAAYNFIDSTIDLDECILYFAAQAYYNNRDWPGNNQKYWRARSGSKTKWRWIIYDLDFGFNLYESDGHKEDHISFMFTVNNSNYAQAEWAIKLQKKLIENPTIRNRFINQIADLLNTNFKSERVVSTINEMADHIANELPRHRQRFGIGGENRDNMITFAKQRPAYLRNHVRNYFKCGVDGNLTIDITEGGTVKLNTLSLQAADAPWTGIYFQGNAVNLKAIPKPGYKFDGWSGAVTSSDVSLSINVTISTNLIATFSATNNAVKNVVINEINYNSADDFDSGDWVEFYNNSDSPIDISDWFFKDNDDSHIFTFPSGTILESSAYLVLGEESEKFIACYPDVTNFVGEMNFGLSGSGELIRLFDSEGQIVDSLTYSDKAPWPAEADGQGATLELFAPNLDNTNGENWRASVGHGSPGQQNTVTVAIAPNDSREIPEKFNLMQNYPNPFNHSTVILFQISEPSFVKLSVYDLNGRLIETLVNEYRNPGYYAVHWNAENVVSGIYFYRIEAGSLSSVKKCLLVK